MRCSRPSGRDKDAPGKNPIRIVSGEDTVVQIFIAVDDGDFIRCQVDVRLGDGHTAVNIEIGFHFFQSPGCDVEIDCRRPIRFTPGFGRFRPIRLDGINCVGRSFFDRTFFDRLAVGCLLIGLR
jgi:hypothetical protein